MGVDNLQACVTREHWPAWPCPSRIRQAWICHADAAGREPARATRGQGCLSARSFLWWVSSALVSCSAGGAAVLRRRSWGVLSSLRIGESVSTVSKLGRQTRGILRLGREKRPVLCTSRWHEAHAFGARAPPALRASLRGKCDSALSHFDCLSNRAMRKGLLTPDIFIISYFYYIKIKNWNPLEFIIIMIYC